MEEDHGAPEAGQFPSTWTRSCRSRRETELPKSERYKESVSWTVQNEKKCILRRMFTGAA